MKEKDQYEKIERYLSDEMSKEERAAFEAKIEQQPALAKEVDLHKEIAIAIGSEEEQEIMFLRSKINNTVIQHRSRKTRTIGRFRYLVIAASILIVGSIGLLIFQNLNTNSSPSELYQAYAELPNDFLTKSSVRGEEDLVGKASTEIDFSDFHKSYQQGNYTIALSELDDILQENSNLVKDNPSRYYYYQGITNLQLEHFEEAKTAFQQVKNIYSESAAWYLALTHLQTEGFSETTMTMLSKISNSSSPFAPKAKALLDKFPSKK